MCMSVQQSELCGVPPRADHTHKQTRNMTMQMFDGKKESHMVKKEAKKSVDVAKV